MISRDEELNEVLSEMEAARTNNGEEVSRTTIAATTYYKGGFYYILPHCPLKCIPSDAKNILLSLVKK